MLGGSLYQTYAIREAVRQGLYVVTCDYLPGNPGHRLAHEYHDVSTTDREAVLALARRLGVEGVVAYASDPAAPTAAYVCEQLGLPTSPYESVRILSEKDRFRRFLAEHGFNVPRAKGYTALAEAEADKSLFRLPVMVKPVDSSGSKGITKLETWGELPAAVREAMSYSRAKRFIIEEFIVKKGWQISGDCFSVDGRLVFHCFGNEYYSPDVAKPFAPLGECWPFLMDGEIITRLVADLQRLITLLSMGTTAYNVEAIVDGRGEIYILELGARSGGSLIPQVTAHATGVDMVPYVIRGAMGDDCSALSMAPVRGCWANYMVHANATGRYRGTWFDPEFRRRHLVDYVTAIRPGDPVHAFRDAQDCTGELILSFATPGEMLAALDSMDRYVRVEVE